MRCTVCKTPGDEVELFDGILMGEMAMVCANCAETEGIPIIKKPSESQIGKADKRYSVRDRLERLSGRVDVTEISDDQTVIQRNLAKLRMPEKKETHDDLFDDYYWKANMARRRKKLTIGQLSEQVGIDEETLKSIEKGKIPKDFHEIFMKLERFFGEKFLKQHPPKVNFVRTRDEEEEILRSVKEKMQSPTIEDDFDKERERERKEKLDKISKGQIDFSKRKELENIKLSDLVDMKRAKDRREAEAKKKSMVGEDIDLDLDVEEL